MAEGHGDAWLHFIHQTLVNPSGGPRNFMKATVNEKTCVTLGGEPSSLQLSPISNAFLFSPSLHRLCDHKPVRQVLVTTATSTTQLPMVACLLTKTGTLSLTTEIWNLEFPQESHGGEGKGQRRNSVSQEEILDSLTTFLLTLQERLELRQWPSPRAGADLHQGCLVMHHCFWSI